MRKLFIAQIVLIVLVACVWGVIDHAVTPSVLYGGAVCLVSNLFFAYSFFCKKHTRGPAQILIAFYAGEFLKLVLSALIMILAIKYLNARIVPTLVGYFAANVAFWMAPALVLKQQVRSS